MGRIAILPLENPPSPRPGSTPRGERREGSSRLKQGNASLRRRTRNSRAERPQRVVRGDTVAQPLLELLELGKTPFGTTRPDRRAVHAHLEYAARTRHQRHLAQLLGERQQL